MRKITLTFILLSVLAFSFLAADFSPADYNKKDIEAFDERTDYNIYFYSAQEQATVIEHIEIVGFKEIAGKIFLVIRSAGFDLKDREGFILFDSISAILPEKNFRVENNKRKIRY